LKIRWTPEAAADLARIYEFLGTFHPEGALRVVRSLRAAVDQLAIHPRLGTRLDGFDGSEVRRLIVGNYEMRYRVVEEAIQILRFFHTREDR
jgi:addiction module RelE/StbE family toxin